jgi:hypothetical protein
MAHLYAAYFSLLSILYLSRFLGVNSLLVFQIFALKPAVQQAFLNLVPSKVERTLNFFSFHFNYQEGLLIR